MSAAPLVITDQETGTTARIAAHLGMNCFDFRARVDGHPQPVAVLDAAEEFVDGNGRPSGHGIPILFPYPNRIRAGRFRWDGRNYELPDSLVAYDPAGNAIHGLCLDRPWHVADRGQDFVTGQFQLSREAPDRLDLWPTDFLLEIRFQVRGACLRIDVTVTNPTDRPLPWGFGTHPYFRLPLGTGSDPHRCRIEAPVSEQWELADCLPTGSKRPVDAAHDLQRGVYFGQRPFDDVFSASASSAEAVVCRIVDEPAGVLVVQRTDPLFRELVVYTPPDRDSVCLEPYTCVTDAANLQSDQFDAGWRVLEPSGEIRTWIEIEAGAAW